MMVWTSDGNISSTIIENGNGNENIGRSNGTGSVHRLNMTITTQDVAYFVDSIDYIVVSAMIGAIAGCIFLVFLLLIKIQQLRLRQRRRQKKRHKNTQKRHVDAKLTQLENSVYDSLKKMIESFENENYRNEKWWIDYEAKWQRNQLINASTSIDSISTYAFESHQTYDQSSYHCQN